MAININDFFLFSGFMPKVSGDDYTKIEPLINAVEAFVRSTHKYVYIIDCSKQEFLHVSENMGYLCGVSADRIKDLGYRFFLDYVPEADQQMILEVNSKGFDLYNEIPLSGRMDYSMTYDFHIINGKRQRLVNHTLTPMSLTRDGHVWLALCTLTLSANNLPGHIIMKIDGDNKYYEYSLAKHQWRSKNMISLSEVEREILILSAQGYTMHDIGDRLCKSVDTIKGYKRNLFVKLGVRSITGALSLAINYRLL